MKIKLDSNTRLLYYAEIKTASPTIYFLVHKHTDNKGQVEITEHMLDIFFVYPNGEVSRKGGNIDADAVRKVKYMVSKIIEIQDTIMIEEELNHDSFSEMMSWLMTKPGLMKLISD